MEFVEVDGSQGEGGGQILRTAVAFASILRKPVRVSRVRAGRGVPGLKRQHISALTVLAKVFGGELGGAVEGSSTVTFVPGAPEAASLSVDMGTAASITLVLQAVVPAVALSGGRLRLDLTGGTDVPWSPTFDYFANVVRDAYGLMGIRFQTMAAQRGYYPRGGGRAVTTIEPCDHLAPLDLCEGGTPREAQVQSRCGGLPVHVAERQLSAASTLLDGAGIRVSAAESSAAPSSSPGSSILIYSRAPGAFLGSDGIGARGKPAEEVGREAAARFVAEAGSGACMDSNLSDMVLPLLSLAHAKSRVRVRAVSSHLKSGMEIAELFTHCSWSVGAGSGSCTVAVTPRSRT